MIQATTEDARKLITEGLVALSNASIEGIGIDIKYCLKQEKILKLKLQKLITEFKSSKTGILWGKVYRQANFNSDMQLRDILFKKLKLPAINRTEPSTTYPNGQPVVDNDTLELLSKQNKDLLPYIQYKKYDKVLNTYISGIIKEQVKVGGTLFVCILKNIPSLAQH
jgi:DNA polymerase I-like protein with 3'-5' exonuclease and polymerase domains